MHITKLILVVAFALGLVLSGTAFADDDDDDDSEDASIAGGGPPSTVYRFAGYTDDEKNELDDTINGGQGWFAMVALCQDDFGPNARPCVGEEFWLTLDADLPNASSWLHHTTSGGNFFGGGDVGSQTCSGWTLATTARGQVVDTDGKHPPTGGSCDEARPVICCTPMQ